MASPTTPYSFIKQGQLFIIPVGPSISEVPYPVQTLDRAPEYSLWVNGAIQDGGVHLDNARMPPSLYQEVRDDLVRYSPVEVSRSAFGKSNHAYTGVIDSRGKPYYFALDSRGISVREAKIDDEKVWKTFERLAAQEHMMAMNKRRHTADQEMVEVEHELSTPKLVVLTKSFDKGRLYAAMMRFEGAKLAEEMGEEDDLDPLTEEDLEVLRAYGIEKSFGAFVNAWTSRPAKQARPAARPRSTRQPKQPKPARTPSKAAQWREKYPAGAVAKQYPRMKAFLDGGGLEKALPKKSKEKPVKKTPNKTASKKQAGAGGKTRYTYPSEKGGAKKPGAKKPGSKQQPLAVAVHHDDSKNADPAELANQLNVSVRTITHVAKQLGREEFSKYMRSHLKRFAAKHRLDPDYWNTLYEKIMSAEPPKIA